MEKFEVKVSREWAKRQIDTVVRCTEIEIAITMPLPQFVTLLGELTAEKLPILFTRAQMKARLAESATALVAQMKENTRQVMTPQIKA